MSPIKIALVGAGSRSFGPATVRDVLLSKPLTEAGVHLVLMDKVAERLVDVERYCHHVIEHLGVRATVEATTDLRQALDRARFVVCAVEVNRFLYWCQDFHIPRRYGFRQVFGENGGPGGLFHALRNMVSVVEIARTMEQLCPDAWLINYSNPEHKLCEAVSRLTSIQVVGLCHGFFMGLEQIARILEIPAEEIEATACGINHFTWFQTIRHRRTGEDLYPLLRQKEREGDWLSDWHEIGLGRILLRRFGLYPSPAANHYGEYIRWADEFVCSQLQFFYDPADGQPWQTGRLPEFIYSLTGDPTHRPWKSEPVSPPPLEDAPLQPSGELAAPIMESIACGVPHELPAVNVPNRGAIPNLPDETVVEVPARSDASGIHPLQMEPLPEGIAAMLRLQASIHQLLVEAFAEQSKDKLIQAVLLEPTVDSYRNAVQMVDEMLELQREVLPPLH
ncbi:MAG: alpha-galactosidase [Armatimonadota bacterium]|nr:alpha-galactosidase [Armatimonadota bacterium]